MGFHGMGFSGNSRALQRLLGFVFGGVAGLRISGCVGFGCKLCRFMGQEI